MTEKRFVDYFDKDHNYIIQDLQNEDEYQVGFVNCDEDVFLKLVNELAEENKQLKQQKAKYKRLSEIRNEEINNRILTIKEFIDNCSNEKVKKALEDLFYSEVNEYDLSKKYRKLHDKYKKLQLENNGLKYALKYIKKIDVEIDVGDFND